MEMCLVGVSGGHTFFVAGSINFPISGQTAEKKMLKIAQRIPCHKVPVKKRDAKHVRYT